MIINVTFDSSVGSAPAGFIATVDAVVQFYETQFTDPITVNIDVGYGEVDGQALGSGALGESITYLNSFSYAQLRSALAADATSAADQTAVASLPSSNPAGTANFWVATAEAKALGLAGASSSLDGFIGFSSAPNIFDYNNADGVTAGQYDFFGVVAHEISEVLGRLVLGGSGYSPLSLFDYSAACATCRARSPDISPSMAARRISTASTAIPAAIWAIGPRAPATTRSWPLPNRAWCCR